jgi:replicative DNA helicase
MFIHRDKNKDETDKPNIAEILIEKHRNGPTGMVELYFDDTKSGVSKCQIYFVEDFCIFC